MHAIMKRNGKDAMAYFGEKPWHGQGTEVQQAMTSKEAIELAHLDYEVEKREIYVPSMDKTRLNGNAFDRIKDQFAIVRKDTGDVFGVVGRVYRPLQNKEAFSFFDSIVGSKEAMYHTCGALFQGQKIWLLAKLPGAVQVTKNDVVEKYLLLYNSHDGTSTVQIMFTPIRVVCNNTLNMALTDARENKNAVKLRHTINIATNIEGIRDQLGIANNFYKMFEQMSQHLVSKTADSKMVEDLLASLGLSKDKAQESTRTENMRETIQVLFEKGKGNDLPGVRGTAWALLNGVTEFADHYKTIRAKDENSDSSRVSSLLFGSGAALKQKALDNLLSLTK